jgi:hypothetical protein
VGAVICLQIFQFLQEITYLQIENGKYMSGL